MIWRIQWQNPQSFWIAALLLVVSLTAIVWLYRGQLRAAPFSMARLLLPLRSLSLGVLAVSLLRPAVLRPIAPNQQGVIAVLVDQSKSMSVVDSRPSSAQLVQLASALGMLSEEVRPLALSDTKRDLDDLRPILDELARADSALSYAKLAGRSIDSAQNHLSQARMQLDHRLSAIAAKAPGGLAESIAQISREAAGEHIAQVIARITQQQQALDEQLYHQNNQVQRACDELAQSSRIELVRRALGSESGLIEQISAQRRSRVFGFAESAAALPPVDRLTANGSRGELSIALRQIRQQLAGQRLAAVVLFSDGRRVGADSAAAVLGTDVPVLAVMSGGPIDQDLAISHIHVPARAFVGQTIQIGVDIAAAGFDGREVQITVECAGERHTQPALIQNRRAAAAVPVHLLHPGPQELMVQIASQPGEVTEENNQAKRIINVASERIRVALLAGVATWDTQYLRSALRGDSSIELIDRQIDAEHPAISPQQILDRDVIILNELSVELLEARQWDAITRQVQQNGGSVIIIANDTSILADYAANPLAASLLPWRLDASPAAHVWPGEDALYRIAPVAGDSRQASRFWDESDATESRWNDLAPVFRFISLPPLRARARPLLVESDSNQPVLCEIPVGTGRAFFLGIGEIWRWRDASPLGQEAGFWSQLLHRASGEQSSPASVEPDIEVEMRDLSADESELRKLVGSGGQVLKLSEISSLPQRISRLRESEAQFAQVRLWDSPYLFLLVLGCLGLEWSIRKNVGLV